MLRRFADLSLRAKLVAMCLLLVLALSAMLLVELPRAMDAQWRGWVVSRSLGLGRLLASALEASVDFDDAASATRVLQGIRTSRGAAHRHPAGPAAGADHRRGAPGGAGRAPRARGPALRPRRRSRRRGRPPGAAPGRPGGGGHRHGHASPPGRWGGERAGPVHLPEHRPQAGRRDRRPQRGSPSRAP